MTPILAKWIFTFAATLNPGADLQLPAYGAERIEGVQEITMTSVASSAPVACPGGFSPGPVCTPSAGGAQLVFRRFICVPPGVYSLVARVGLAPLAPDVEAFRGSIWWGSSAGGPDSGALLIMDLEAKRDAWVNAGGAHVFIAPGLAPSCYQFTYTATGRATLNPDRRVSYLAIVKLAD